MTTVSQAVQKREQGPQALITQYTSDFRQVLPTHIKAETFVRLSQGVLRRNADLATAANNNPGSFLGALLECARLGHEPGTDAFALVPIGGAVEGWEQYQGVIERIYRAGAVRSVKAEVVRKNDSYRFKRSTMQVPEHDPDDFASEADRGPLVGVYSYAEMSDGSFSRVVVMSKDAVMKHKAMSKGSESATSPWKKWPESMWLKCAVHELEKWVPTSSEYRREQLRAAAEIRDSATSLPPTMLRPVSFDPGPEPQGASGGEVVDGEVVDEPAADPEKDRRRLFAILGELGVKEREDRLAVYSAIVGRPVASTDELDVTEVQGVADTLDGVTRYDGEHRVEEVGGLIVEGKAIRSAGES